MATIKEIAKACHVSVATVSNILNDKPGASENTREMVLKVAREMDYMPNYVAKNLKTKNSRSIGAVSYTHLDVYKRQGIRWDLMAAAGSLYIIPMLVIVIIFQKAIVRGMTLGSVKG